MRTLCAAVLVATFLAGCSSGAGSSAPSGGCKIVGPCLLPDGGAFESTPSAFDYVCEPGEFPVADPGRDCLRDDTRGGGAMCCMQP
jgi:hypothetical protein